MVDDMPRLLSEDDDNMLENSVHERRNMGMQMPVVVYRLLEYAIRDSVRTRYGKDEANEVLREAGQRSGRYFTGHFLNVSLKFEQFIAQLQKTMMEMRMGILRVEEIRKDGTIILTISEDLDCSGLPVTGETICSYDEGFIVGVMSAYMKKPYEAVEIDCWANGDRICRFRVNEKRTEKDAR